MNKNYFFVHIPKTAGTSFSIALENNENVNMLYDYGINKAKTTRKLLNIDTNDINQNIFDPNVYNIICGHVCYEKYAHCTPKENLITILRNPVERVVSEFQHLTRVGKLSKTFLKFCSSPAESNKQHRMLNNYRLNNQSLIGLTSHYKYFIEVFNKSTGLSIDCLSINNAPETDIHYRYHISPEEIKKAFFYNKKDMSLFFDSVYLFMESVKEIGFNIYPEPSTAWNCRIDYKKNKIVGWVNVRSTDCYFILVSVNNEKRAVISLNEPRPDIFKKGLTNDIFCGFSYPLSLLGLINNDELTIAIINSSSHLKNIKIIC